jgi:hypothetical protein
MPSRLRFLQQFLLTASLSSVAYLGTGYSRRGGRRYPFGTLEMMQMLGRSP